MAEPPDLESLARRYLDLWQEHLSAAAADPALARQVGLWFELMGTSFQDLRPAGAAREEEPGHDDESEDGQPATTTRPAASTAPSGDGVLELAELTRRLRDLEARVAELEAGPRRAGGRARARPRGHGA